MTPNELIFDIREKLKEYVDDTKFTDSYLLYQIDKNREVMIRQQYNNIQRPIDEQLIQTVILPLTEIDAKETGASEPSYETIMRTTVALPSIVELHHRNMLERVATIGKQDRPINVLSRKRFLYAGYGDYDKDQIFCYMDEAGYIFITSTGGEELNYEEIAVSVVMSRPLDQLNYTSGQSGRNLDSFRYPLNMHMAEVVTDIIVQKLANIKVLPSDDSNDSGDDATLIDRQLNG